MYSYLFEAKSIQGYLFSSGRVRDVIAASERLDSLVDSEENSVLSKVIKAAGLESDLQDKNKEPTSDNNQFIRFLRCKGGAFYACCPTEEPLVTLRSLWTLTIHQSFPSLEFVDALTYGDSLKKSIEKGHKKLAENRNVPEFKFPIASPIIARAPRTGNVQVPISSVAKYGSIKDDWTVDLDTMLHREAYQNTGQRGEEVKVGSAKKTPTSGNTESPNITETKLSNLQKRFTPPSLYGKNKRIAYPINLEEEFEFSARQSDSENRDAAKDIALIHLDGNGLGILLRVLKLNLADTSDDEYRKGFRTFSEALGEATKQAAQSATQKVFDKVRNQSDFDKGEWDCVLPMRPLVLGGDDLTLLCRADLAIEYSKVFCKTFKAESQKHLEPIFSGDYLKKGQVSEYLTASGGILFHKAAHPFINSHELVEELARAAKALTKSFVEGDVKVGPAALSFYRLSAPPTAKFKSLFDQKYRFQTQEGCDFTYAVPAFLVEPEPGKDGIQALEDFAEYSNKKSAISMKRWRQIATHLSNGDMDECQRLYERGIELKEKQQGEKSKAREELIEEFAKFTTHQPEGEWYWRTKDNHLETIIGSLLIVDHFKPIQAKTSEEAK